MPQKLADHIANSWRHLDRSYQSWVESLERFLFNGEEARAKLPSNPESLRAQAVRLFAMAIQVRETEDADELIAEAVELQDQATTMEQAAKLPPNERVSFAPRCAQEQRLAAAEAAKALRPCEGWPVEPPASWPRHPPSAEAGRQVGPRFAARRRDRVTSP